MAVLYADRARVYLGGQELLDAQSLTVNMNMNVKAVSTFSADRTNKGWVRGNKDITFSFETAVQSSLSSAKLESIDYDTQDVAIQFLQGADKYLLKGVVISSMSQSASGVGQEARKTFQGMALDLVDMSTSTSAFTSALSNLV